MSWLFSQALVGAFSRASCSDGARSALSSVMPTAHPFLRRGKTTDASTLSRSGRTYAVLTEGRGEELLTWFRAGFRARTSAPQERVPASKGGALACGPSSPESFAKFDPLTHSWKTAQPCLLGDSMSSLVIWPRSGSMRNGACMERPQSDYPIAEIACGSSLPTPSGVNGGHNNTMGRIDEWGGSSNPLRGTVIGSMCLPEFEEMVMGWPIAWTAPTPYETGRFREWQREHGSTFMHDSMLRRAA